MLNRPVCSPRTCLPMPTPADLPARLPGCVLNLSMTGGPVKHLSLPGTAGGMEAVASVEWDFGDARHSYQAAPTHVYQEPGRRYSGFVTVTDRQGQAIVKTFVVDTLFPAAALANRTALTASLGLVPVMRLALKQACVPPEQGTLLSPTQGACLPALLLARNMTAGIRDDPASTVAVGEGVEATSPPRFLRRAASMQIFKGSEAVGDGLAIAGRRCTVAPPGPLALLPHGLPCPMPPAAARAGSTVALSPDNLLWQQGRPGEGQALRPVRLADSATWDVPTSSAHPFSAGAVQGLALEAWLYVEVRCHCCCCQAWACRAPHSKCQ